MKLQSFLTNHKDWALNPSNIYQICIYHQQYSGEEDNPVFIHGDDYIKPFEDKATDIYQDYIKTFVDDLENGNIDKSKRFFIKIEYLKVASTFDLFNEMRRQYVKTVLPYVYNRGFHKICVYICPNETLISLL